MQRIDGSIMAKNPEGFTAPFQTKAYTTSMSLLVLAVEHRFLPIYER